MPQRLADQGGCQREESMRIALEKLKELTRIWENDRQNTKAIVLSEVTREY